MNLVIDQGNTVCKVAICTSDRLLKSYVLPRLTAVDVHRILDRHPEVSASIYSNVAQVNTELTHALKERLELALHLNVDTPLPMQVCYDRQVIGSDRLAAAVGSKVLCPQPLEILVVDAGTAVTYERISAEGVYIGGNISPGLSLRMKALNQFTERLPWVQFKGVEVAEYGLNTQEAIISGVVSGLVYEVEGYINQLRQQFPEAVVILAGGDSLLLQERLKNKTYAVRNLVLYGLNKILEYNK